MKWADRGACAKSGLDFFVDQKKAKETEIEACKALCAQCPVRQQCLDHALSKEPHGIWGGYTELERVKMGGVSHNSMSSQYIQMPLSEVAITLDDDASLTPDGAS